MTALATGAMRDTPRMGEQGTTVNLGCAASTNFKQGGMIARDASGYATPATAALGAIGVYRGPSFTSTATAAAENINVEGGIYRFANGTTAIDIDDIGAVFYVQDDQTLSLTSGGTMTAGGVIVNVDTVGVWGNIDILDRKS